MSDAQSFEDRFAQHLRSYATAAAPKLEQETAARAIAAGVASRRRRPITLPWTPRALQPHSSLPRLVAAAVVVLIVMIGFAILRDGNHQVIGPAVSPTPPSPSSAASLMPSIGPGSVLKWSRLDAGALGLSEHSMGDIDVTRVMWLDDHFVLADQSLRTVFASTDGVTWDVEESGSRDFAYYEPMVMDSIASWQHEVVGWSGGVPGNVSVAQPPNEPRTRQFEGVVGAAGVGPAGIVVRTHSTLDFDAYISSLMGPDWVDHMTSFEFTDGVLRITTDDHRELEIVWADHGFEPGDLADRGFGWHSPDGDEWAPIRNFPDNVSDIVGTEDGFIARGSDMWHSEDGLTWRRLGSYASGLIVPWMGGVIVVPEDGGPRRGFEVWTSDGPRAVPIASDLQLTWRSTGSGPLGIVSLGADDSILYSPDGFAWSISPMPAGMPADANGRLAPTIAVGERSVVVLLWREEIGGSAMSATWTRSPSLWIGTPER